MAAVGFEFPNHPKVGDWETLQGGTLEVHMQDSLESGNSGGTRPMGYVAGAGTWNSLLLPVVPVTRGGGTMAK